MQNPGPFIAINCSQLTPAQGELPIASHLRLINGDMKRAVHRLELILYLINGHGGIHILAVKIEMTAGLPQIKPCYMRRIKQFIIMPVMFILPIVL